MSDVHVVKCTHAKGITVEGRGGGGYINGIVRVCVRHILHFTGLVNVVSLICRLNVWIDGMPRNKR